MNKYNLDILLVDDDKEILNIFSNSLNYLVSSVDTAKCAKDGLELFKNNSYDLVITDLAMPHKNGEELIKEIKEINEDTQIIVISAYSNEFSRINQAIDMGVTRFINKPVNMNLLRKMLEELYQIKQSKKCQIDLARVNDKLNKSAIRHLKSIEEKDTLIAHQSKNILMGEMFAMITHQLKQPISASMMLAGGMKLKLEMNYDITKDELLKNLDILLRNFEYFKDTIDGFNVFYKNKNKSNVNLKKVINDTLKLIEPTIKKESIKIDIDIKDTIEFFSYENEFKQVILNLINNAKDALVEAKIDDPTIQIVAKNNSDHIYLYIIDNAGGLDIKLKDKIFNEHFTTKGDKGTGLGLYMTKLIVEKQFNGNIEVNVAEGKTIFKIVLNYDCD